MPTIKPYHVPPMTAAEFRAALERIGFAQTELENDAGISACGRAFGVSDRAARAWAAAGPPPWIATGVRLMLAVKRAGIEPIELLARENERAGRKRR